MTIMNTLSTQTPPFRGGHVGKAAKTFPYLSLLTSFTMLLFGLLPNNEQQLAALSFNYSAIVDQHEYWRLISGHLIHSSWDHLFWDLITFTVAASYLERQSRNLWVCATVVSTLILDLYLLSPLANIEYYAGISGVLYALITLAGLFWYSKEKSLLGLLPLSAIAIKTLFELTAQNAVFVTDGWHLYAPAHLIGASIGITLWLLCRRYRLM
jgi:rhomboid family GlyGly-CTERM serine protease